MYRIYLYIMNGTTQSKYVIKNYKLFHQYEIVNVKV